MSKAKQEQAYSQLFSQFNGLLFRIAWTYLKSEEEAREAVQEVFISIWHKRDELSFNEGLKAYLIRSIRNRSLNMIRSRNNRPDTVAIEDRDFAAPEESDMGPSPELLQKVQNEIKRLPQKCREIFILSRVDGLSYKEIAEILEISTKTVENQISIALKKLRERLNS